jgi:RNA polymerase sigma-70 factor (ECF subfamily)
MTTRDSEELDQSDMLRLQAGEDSALDSLMARHAGPLFGFLCRFVGDEDSANDLAQETFVRVYRNRAEFQPGRPFSAWLFTIGANLARNHRRARSRRPEVSLGAPATEGGPSPVDSVPSPEGTPSENLQSAECRAAVRHAVSELPEALRDAVVLCELEDRPLAEAAGILRTSVKSVESSLYRARKVLRQQLAGWFLPHSAGPAGLP